MLFAGKNLSTLPGNALRALRREMQVVFQDPYGSLSPRMSIAQIIEEGLKVHKIGDTPAVVSFRPDGRDFRIAPLPGPAVAGQCAGSSGQAARNSSRCM